MFVRCIISVEHQQLDRTLINPLADFKCSRKGAFPPIHRGESIKSLSF